MKSEHRATFDELVFYKSNAIFEIHSFIRIIGSNYKRNNYKTANYNGSDVCNEISFNSDRLLLLDKVEIE